LFDGFGLEILGEGFADERGELVVGGEAQGDQLFDGELVDVSAIFSGKKGGEAEALFETDDAVLRSQSAVTGSPCHHEEDYRQGDPPKAKSPVGRPVVNGYINGEDKVEQEHRQNEEVKRRIPACVVFEVLC